MSRNRRRQLVSGGVGSPFSGPYFIGAGTLLGASSAGTASPPWPVGHQAADIGLLFCETANNNQNTPAGWTVVGTQGTGSGVTATRLQCWWARAASDAEPAPGLTSVSVDHRMGVILGFRGCVASGNPVHVSAGDVAAAATTAIAIPGGTTTIDKCLIVAAVANGIDLAGPQVTFDAPYAEVFDQNLSLANGGGIAVATLLQSIAGIFTGATGTLSGAFVQGRISLALLPDIPP